MTLTADEERLPSQPATKPRQYIDGARIPSVATSGSSPVTIHLSDAELSSGKTNPDTIQECLTSYHRNGIVVLENAIPDTIVDHLYARMVSDNAAFLRKDHMRWNQGAATKNVSQSPPLTPEILSREVYANPHVVRVLENILGPQPELRFVSSNAAVPGGTGRQAVHSDVHHKWPSMPFGLVVNIYLQDSGPENGVTEVWCGTHNAYAREEQQVSKDVGWIRKECIQGRARVRMPVQPRVRRGGMCIRDLRLWHAGMPNRSGEMRIMLAVDYFAGW